MGVPDAINHASLAAADLVYEFAGTFDRREDYEPLERLAQAVQATFVRKFCEAMKDAGT